MIENTDTQQRMPSPASVIRSIFFFHPDFTVGTGIEPVQSFLKESRTVPPIGNFTLP
jgi:hypothetical protein